MSTPEDKPAETDAAEESGRRSQDPELLCMGRIIRILEDQSAEAKARMLAYLFQRYQVDGGDKR